MSITLFFIFFLLIQSQKVDIIASGNVSTLPNAVLVIISTEVSSETAEQATNGVNESPVKVLSYLKENGVEDQDITVLQKAINPIFDDSSYETENQAIVGYVAKISIQFLIKDLPNLESILNGIYDLKVWAVDDKIYKVLNLEDFQPEARSRAIANATEIATQFARKIDETIQRIYSIQHLLDFIEYVPEDFGYYQPTAGEDGSSQASTRTNKIIIWSFFRVSFLISK